MVLRLRQPSLGNNRSGNILGTVFDSLANGSESATITYDNSVNKDLYAIVTIKLGSITPVTRGSITLRITINDGTDTEDKIGGDSYIIPLMSGTSAKVAVYNMVQLSPFSLKFSLINNSGVTTAVSGNELYVLPWNEELR